MSKTVALLVGGWSAERQVSLDKGRAVEAALKEGGYSVNVIDVSKDIPALIKALTPKPDAVFNNLYGKGGEDGEVQSLLEMLEIPYTHSGVLASSIGMDKPMAKIIAESVGVKTPKGQVFSKADVLSGNAFDTPFVVKPPAEGSSVGVRIVMGGDNEQPIDEASWEYGDEVLVEEYIKGRELTVAVLDGKAQGVTEIVSNAKFFDYEAKYQDTSTEYILPAKISEDVYKAALDFAERVYNSIGCRGLARCDFRFDNEMDGAEGLFLLEINTQPGLTAESIGPSQVVRNGMSFIELCSHLVETATCYELENRKKQQDQREAEKRRA